MKTKLLLQLLLQLQSARSMLLLLLLVVLCPEGACSHPCCHLAPPPSPAAASPCPAADQAVRLQLWLHTPLQLRLNPAQLQLCPRVHLRCCCPTSHSLL
jgi:hypothetical protein